MSTTHAQRVFDRPGLLAFRMELEASTPEALAIWPVNNRVGTVLLRQHLAVALAARLPEAATVAGWNELNRSRFVVSAGNLRVALEVVIEELRTVALLPFAHVVWQDLEEQVWRTHPAGLPGQDLLTGTVLDLAAMQTFRREFSELVARLRAQADVAAREARKQQAPPPQ
jgi:hypothetical protein